MAARVPAHDAIAVGITKRLRDECGTGPRRDLVHAFAGEVGNTVADHLASPNCLELLTRFVGELHAARLDGEARRMGEGGHG